MMIHCSLKPDDTAADQTASIQQAIDHVHEQGGGIVAIPPGRWTSGTVYLRSKVELHLERGAELRATAEEDLFPVLCATPYGNLPGVIRALVVADRVHDIAITGAGVLHGNGDSELWGDDVLKEENNFRPALLFMRDCRQILLRDIRLHYSAFWTCHLLRCEDVLIDAIDLRTHHRRINTDGIDPDGCRNVRIRGCTIDSTDDAICLKSTEGDVCEDIIVSDCVLTSRCCALKIGTEGVGTIRRVLMHHCLIRGSTMGVALYQKDGSTYEDISVVDCTMVCNDHFPVFIDVTPRDYRSPTVGRIRRVLLADLRVFGPGRCYLRGHPDSPLSQITMRGLRWLVSGPEEWATAQAPTGARRVNLDPERIDDAQKPYHLLITHAQDCRIQDVFIDEERSEGVGDRGAVWARSCQAVSVAVDHRLRSSPTGQWLAQVDCTDSSFNFVEREACDQSHALSHDT